MDITISYKVESCIRCGFQFAVPTAFQEMKIQDHSSFFCPSCKHSMYYPDDNEVEKLKKETKKLKKRLDDEISCCIKAQEQANKLEKKVWGYKGYATKLKKKIEKKSLVDQCDCGTWDVKD